MYVRIAPMLLAAWLAGPPGAHAQVAEGGQPSQETRPSQAPGTGEQACQAPQAVRVGRVWGRHNVEERRLVLTTCEGTANRAALDELSLLARPREVDRPTDEQLAAFREERPDGRLVAPGIPRLHPGLLTRMQAIADRFPGRRIEIISGYRPQARSTSRHRHARALDVRVQGVSRAHVSELLRTLPETGVGYYPNSLFTHVDVREQSAYWVDRSAPGQPSDYGRPRTPARNVEEERREIVAKALTALDSPSTDRAGASTGRPDVDATTDRPGAHAPTRHRESSAGNDPGEAGDPSGPAIAGDAIDWTPPDPFYEDEPHEGEELGPEEVARLRQELLDAVRSLRD